MRRDNKMFMIKSMTKQKINNPEPLILAVSGGVDSVVMLDVMRRRYQNIVLAHFEHGIRGAESRADAQFVRSLARKYNLSYEIASGNLGTGASEDTARQARYSFLRRVAEERGGILCTAHHADDVIESIVINIRRGTGWRGLSVMGSRDIYRPLLNLSKAEVLNYAIKNKLDWREDSTNHQPIYLRNVVRQQLANRSRSYSKEILFELFERQVLVRNAIDSILSRTINKSGKYRRYNFIMADDKLAYEVFYFIVKHHSGVSLLRSQVERAILAIKTAKQGEIHQLAGRVYLDFTTQFFIVKTDKK